MKVMACLNGKDVISEKVSDHHPIFFNGVLFWNVMMQAGRRKNSTDYNNAFKIIETDNQYRQRLKKIACVIAEIIYRQPLIYAINLCEGPIRNEHVQLLFNCLQHFSWTKRFTESSFHKPAASVNAENWGLLMLADSQYKVKELIYDIDQRIAKKLVNRIGLWQLTHKQQQRYLGLAHFPFSGDEQKTCRSELSEYGKQYCYLTSAILFNFANVHMTFCADFNLNPYLIPHCPDKAPIHNSLLTSGAVTVDGILVSDQVRRDFKISRNQNFLFQRIPHQTAQNNHKSLLRAR